MKMKTDITEILKNKPKSTVLYDALRDVNVGYGHLTKYGISCYTINDTDIPYSRYGTWPSASNGLQILFPSKEMRDWSKFAWKKGDVLANNCGFMCIFKEWASDNYTKFNGCYSNSRDGYEEVQNAETMKFNKVDNNIAYEYVREIEKRLGGKLNLETLEIEKPREFKDGDILHAVDTISGYIYICKGPRKEYPTAYCYKLTGDGYLHICDLDNYYDCTLPSSSIISDKTRYATDSEKQQLFDALAKEGKRWNAETKVIEDLPKQHKFKPFEKVLVRQIMTDEWEISFFSHYQEGAFPYHCLNSSYMYCVPYNEQNTHLLGTTDDWKGIKFE